MAAIKRDALQNGHISEYIVAAAPTSFFKHYPTQNRF
jgi:hypothetical protein